MWTGFNGGVEHQCGLGIRSGALTQWFVQTDDGEEDAGPFRPSELLEMVRSGEVTRESKAISRPSARWLPICLMFGVPT